MSSFGTQTHKTEKRCHDDFPVILPGSLFNAREIMRLGITATREFTKKIWVHQVVIVGKDKKRCTIFVSSVKPLTKDRLKEILAGPPDTRVVAQIPIPKVIERTSPIYNVNGIPKDWKRLCGTFQSNVQDSECVGWCSALLDDLKSGYGATLTNFDNFVLVSCEIEDGFESNAILFGYTVLQYDFGTVYTFDQEGGESEYYFNTSEYRGRSSSPGMPFPLVDEEKHMAKKMKKTYATVCKLKSETEDDLADGGERIREYVADDLEYEHLWQRFYRYLSRRKFPVVGTEQEYRVPKYCQVSGMDGTAHCSFNDLSCVPNGGVFFEIQLEDMTKSCAAATINKQKEVFVEHLMKSKPRIEDPYDREAARDQFHDLLTQCCFDEYNNFIFENDY